MSAFAAGINAIFADPNMAKAALYRAGGAGVGVSVRIIFRAPDRLVNWSEGRFVTDTVFLDVRVSDVPVLDAGDTFEIENGSGISMTIDFVSDVYHAARNEIYEVRADPVRDRERLCWAAEVRAL